MRPTAKPLITIYLNNIEQSEEYIKTIAKNSKIEDLGSVPSWIKVYSMLSKIIAEAFIDDLMKFPREANLQKTRKEKIY